jgi:NitT/TauT family transport system substrate-binding protein
MPGSMNKLHASSIGLVLLLAACGGTASSSPAPGSAAGSPSTAVASTPAAASAPTNASAAASAKPAASAAASGSAAATPAASAAASGGAAAKPATSGSAAAGLTKLVVSYSNIVSLELPIWTAQDGGVFKSHGLDVDLRLLESSQGMPALIAGEIQFADISGGTPIDAVAAGADVVDIAEFGPVYPYLFMVPADIKDISGLKGKKVGVSSIGSASDVATRVLLKKVGLEPDKDVSIIAVGSATARTAALLNGAIQGGVQLPPDQLQLESKGFHSLYDMSDLKLPNSNTTETVKRDYMNSHRDVVQKYVDSLVDSAARIRKDKAAAVNVLKKYFKSDDANAMSVAYDYYVGKVMPSLPFPKAEQLQDARDVLALKNPKVKDVDLSRIVEPSFVQSAADRGLDKG